DDAAQGALWRRQDEAAEGDDGALPEGEDQPLRWLSAHAGANAGVHRTVLGADGERRITSGTFYPVARRPVGHGPVFCVAAADGCLDVGPVAAQPRTG